MLMVSLNMLIQLTPQTKCIMTNTAGELKISYMNSQNMSHQVYFQGQIIVTDLSSVYHTRHMISRHVKVQVLTFQVLVIFSNVMVQFL